MSITKEKKAELVKKFGGNEKNTGSVASQVAILTEEIKQITDHVKAHAKDFSSKRGLYKKVQKRRSLLNYLKETDIEQYRKLINDLGVRN